MIEFEKLIEIVRILRGPGGCPWDKAQKIGDFKRYLLEEAYELIEGIDNKDDASVKEELGDLFLILVVISEFYRKKNIFDARDALIGINEKLVSRHPHVFSVKKLAGKEDVLNYWIKTKARKKKRKTVKEKLPLTAPALLMTEIFWREYFHVAGRTAGDKKKEYSRALSGLLENAASLSLKRIGKCKNKIFVEMLFDLSLLAALNQVDLEPELRRKTLKAAENTRY